MIAVEELSTTASIAHTKDSLFRLDGKLYKATSAIAVGDTIVVGTNCVETNIDGEVIKDIQINGTSVVSNGVANVPIAGTNAGAVKVPTNDSYGLHMYSDGSIAIAMGSANDIKNGSGYYKPIVPNSQHQSTFYGLAKAAGADLKDVQNVTVGTYPTTAATAIKTMLQVQEGLEVVRLI